MNMHTRFVGIPHEGRARQACEPSVVVATLRKVPGKTANAPRATANGALRTGIVVSDTHTTFRRLWDRRHGSTTLAATAQAPRAPPRVLVKPVSGQRRRSIVRRLTPARPPCQGVRASQGASAGRKVAPPERRAASSA